MANFVEFDGIGAVNLDEVYRILKDPYDPAKRTVFRRASPDSLNLEIAAPYDDVMAFLRALSIAIPNFEKWARTRPAIAAERVAEARKQMEVGT